MLVSMEVCFVARTVEIFPLLSEDAGVAHKSSLVPEIPGVSGRLPDGTNFVSAMKG